MARELYSLTNAKIDDRTLIRAKLGTCHCSLLKHVLLNFSMLSYRFMLAWRTMYQIEHTPFFFGRQ